MRRFAQLIDWLAAACSAREFRRSLAAHEHAAERLDAAVREILRK